MKILLTGATGLVGKELGKALVSEGHEITVITRNINQAKGNLSYPAKILEWNNYHEDIPAHYFEGIESVIHLAGESIGGARWSNERKKSIYDSRIVGTQKIINAISKGGKSVKQLICASAIGIYGNTASLVDENDSSKDKNDFLVHVCNDWEKEAQKAIELGINVISPRIGIVLSKNGGALKEMLPLFSAGIGGAIGSGKQFMSWIHIEDLVKMFIFFLKNPHLSGAYNAVSSQPVTNKEFSKALADSLGNKLFFPVPEMVIKLALGDMSVLITNGQKVSNKKICDLGFKFKYQEINGALNSLCLPFKDNHEEIFSEIWVPRKINEVFPFFSDEKNLEKLTPQYLNFKVLSKSSEQLQEGTTIDYQLHVHGIPLKWKTLIQSWNKDKSFVDVQLRGPYAIWHHTHEFEEFHGGTIIRDIVKYKLPLGKIGNIFGGNFVRSDVDKIFDYRKKIITKLFYF